MRPSAKAENITTKVEQVSAVVPPGMSILAAHWSKLVGNQHPDDEPVLARSPHTFDLQFPPPAFVGRPDAPIVVLMANGGYKRGITEAEFPNVAVVEGFRAYLRGEARGLPANLSAYYSSGLIGKMIRDGHAVLVNAVPYRSPSLSNEPQNQAVAKILPSKQVHRQWLQDDVLPAARRGEGRVPGRGVAE